MFSINRNKHAIEANEEYITRVKCKNFKEIIFDSVLVIW